jgi:hypothetical protein
MKRYLLPIAALFLVVFGCYYLFDESQRSYARARKSYESMKAQVESSRRQRDASSDQIVSLNKNVRDSVDFLAKWREYYLLNRDYDSLIGKVAERTNCVVLERKWESKKVNLGKLDYPVECFTGSVVGDYKDIVNFIGQMESQQQLCTIEALDFKDGIGGVTCTMEILMPVLPFTGQAAPSSGATPAQDTFASPKQMAAAPAPTTTTAATAGPAATKSASTITPSLLSRLPGESNVARRRRIAGTLHAAQSAGQSQTAQPKGQTQPAAK